MKEIIDFLTTKEVMIILGLLAGVLFLYFVFWFIDFLKKSEEKKKLKNNTLELNRLVEQVAEEKEEADEEVLPEIFNKAVEPSFITPELVTEVEEAIEEKEEPIVTFEKEFTSPIEVQPMVVNPETLKEVATVTHNDMAESISIDEDIVELLDNGTEEIVSDQKEIEPIQYKEEVYTKTEAQQELERLTEELQKASEEDKNISLTEFEIEQEENAIISLEELLEKGKSLTIKNEITQYEDEGNEPISIEELEKRYQQEKEVVVQEKIDTKTEVQQETLEKPKTEQVALFDLKTAPYQTSAGYKPSPIISPIYGIEPQHLNTNDNLELENTANYEKLDEEIRKTNEFLTKLRELQKKLD